MKFEYDHKQYAIEFERQPKMIRVGVDESGNDFFRASKNPYTTVRLIQIPKEIDGVVKGSIIVFRTATVGCWHKDKFSLEKGRINALRLVSQTVSKEFRRAMWSAYVNRSIR